MTCKLRRKRIKRKAENKINKCENHCFRRVQLKSEKHHCISRRKPCKRRCHCRVVNRSHEPSDIISILAADKGLGIVNNTVDFLEFCSHNGESICADYHNAATDKPREQGNRKVTVCDVEHRLCLEENTGTDNDSDNHADSGDETVFLF